MRQYLGGSYRIAGEEKVATNGLKGQGALHDRLGGLPAPLAPVTSRNIAPA